MTYQHRRGCARFTRTRRCLLARGRTGRGGRPTMLAEVLRRGSGRRPDRRCRLRRRVRHAGRGQRNAGHCFAGIDWAGGLARGRATARARSDRAAIDAPRAADQAGQRRRGRDERGDRAPRGYRFGGRGHSPCAAARRVAAAVHPEPRRLVQPGAARGRASSPSSPRSACGRCSAGRAARWRGTCTCSPGGHWSSS